MKLPSFLSPKAPEEPKSDVVKYRNKLTIIQSTDNPKYVPFSLWYNDWDKKNAVGSGWREFIKWYHGRKQSEDFVFRYGNNDEGLNHVCIQRSNIRGYNITLEKIEDK